MKQLRAIIQFDIAETEEATGCIHRWVVNAHGEKPSVTYMRFPNRDAARSDDQMFHAKLSCSDETLYKLSTGSLSPEFAFMKGSLRVKGDMGAALRAKYLLNAAAELSGKK